MDETGERRHCGSAGGRENRSTVRVEIVDEGQVLFISIRPSRHRWSMYIYPRLEQTMSIPSK